eukprot:11190544-Lingulodinium_polyedra.AAC.1
MGAVAGAYRWSRPDAVPRRPSGHPGRGPARAGLVLRGGAAPRRCLAAHLVLLAGPRLLPPAGGWHVGHQQGQGA